MTRMRVANIKERRRKKEDKKPEPMFTKMSKSSRTSDMAKTCVEGESIIRWC